MSTATIAATPRSEFGRRAASKIRAAGSVPATIMQSGKDSVHVTLDDVEAERLLRSKVLTCEVELDGGKRTVLIRDADRDCLTDRLQHIDLLEVDADSQVKVEVPLVPNTINCPGIKAGGLLEQMVRKIKVKCAVAKIPNSIEIDLSNVGIAETVYARDVAAPEGVTILNPGRTSLMSVLKTRAMKKAEADAKKE